jgi:hypothetical protein
VSFHTCWKNITNTPVANKLESVRLVTARLVIANAELPVAEGIFWTGRLALPHTFIPNQMGVRRTTWYFL